MHRAIRDWWREVEPWYVASALACLVQGTASVLIPLAVGTVLGRSVASLGVLSSLVSFVGVVGSLTWGRLADAAYRRKPVLIFSYAMVGACLLGMAFVRTFEQLVLLNMVLNFFWMAHAAVSVLVVIENQEQIRWERKISHIKQLGEIGWEIGLIVGSGAMALGVLWFDEATTIRGAFLLIGLGGIAAAALSARWVPRGGARVAPSERSFLGAVVALGGVLVERILSVPHHLYGRLNVRRVVSELRSSRDLRPGTRRFLAATLAAFTGMGLFSIPLPLLLAQRFHMASSAVFLCFAVQNVAVVAAYPFAARRIKRFGNRRVQMGALALRLAFFVAAALYLTLTTAVPSTAAICGTLAGVGFTWSYLQLTGLALTSRLAKRESRGLAIGLYNGVSGVGWILAGVGSGYLAERVGYHVTFGVAAAFLVLAILVLRFVPEPPVEGSDVVRDAEGGGAASITESPKV